MDLWGGGLGVGDLGLHLLHLPRNAEVSRTMQ